MPPELTTFFSAMLPITELRGSIPFAIQVLGLSPFEAFFWATLGNMIPNFFILLALKPISEFLMKHSRFFKNFFEKLFEKTHQKHSKKFQEFGYLFLVLFVAVPLPGSGGWTGSLIAFLFGVPYWHAVVLICSGIFLAGIFITVGFQSIVRIIESIIALF